MRDYHRERKIAWYVYLFEGLMVFHVMAARHQVGMQMLMAELLFFIVSAVITGIITRKPAEKYSDFLQGALVLSSGVIVYLFYSLSTQSARLLPTCLFFILVEGTMYKNMKLNAFVAFESILMVGITEGLVSLGHVDRGYSYTEGVFTIALMIVGNVLMLLMQTQDLFVERVVREDEKSLDDLLELVEMKCEDATSAAEAKSSFLANMSHEIRTPINAVIGMNEMIIRESSEEDILGYAHNIESASTALLSLINDILDFSKIESGKMEVMPEQYELNALLYDILLVVQPRLEKKKLKLILDIDRNIPNELFGDAVRIRQVITNILTNAVKYTEEGSVTFSVKMERIADAKINLKVAVKDTGIGIKEGKEVLFSAFQRGNDLKAHHIEGTGLGLTITRQLLQMMDSDLDMESEYGKGSVFFFTLPQPVMGNTPMGDINDMYQKRRSQEERYRVSFVAPQAKVLVVDDNAMNRSVVQSLLKQTQVQLDMAENGQQSIELCKKNQYHLILMDHLMPVMDGIEAFHALREDTEGLNYKTPVIILTANAVAGMKQGYLDEGFNGFLSKPVQGQLLEETLMQHLPEELLVVTDAAPEIDTEELARQKLMRDLIDSLQLTDVDLDDALQYSSGTVKDVLENMNGYLTESAPNKERIRKEYMAENWNDLKIHVHALKSTSRVVGAVHMAFLAEKMEHAAADGDVSYIKENFENLMTEYADLCEEFEKLMYEPEIRDMQDKAPEISVPKSEYIMQLKRLLEGVQEYDVDFEQMQSFGNSYPDKNMLKEERAELARAVDAFDYEEIANCLEHIMQLLDEAE